MWPFKKKIELKTSPKIFETIICIPGFWSNIDQIKNSIFEASDGEYMIVGNILIDAKNDRHYKIEFYDYDNRMRESFETAGKVTRITAEALHEIEKHNFVIYITGTTGNLEEIERFAHIGTGILKAGGYGVKIETAGKAFDKKTWLTLFENLNSASLYQMFVIDSILWEDGSIYSCGMQNLGLKDTIISGEVLQDAVDLIQIFSIYQIIDKPVILENQTFSRDKDAPLYRIIDEINQPYKGDFFENPFGMWRLIKE